MTRGDGQTPVQYALGGDEPPADALRLYDDGDPDVTFIAGLEGVDGVEHRASRVMDGARGRSTYHLYTAPADEVDALGYDQLDTGYTRYTGENSSYHGRAAPLVGVLLYLAETDGLAERGHTLAQSAPEALEAHVRWLGDMDDRDRRMRLMDLYDASAAAGTPQHERAHAPMFEGSSWRPASAPDERTRRRVLAAVSRANTRGPAHCYHNAFNVVDEMLLMGMASDFEIEYAEGLMLPKQAGRLVNHAWVEVSRGTVEPTLPDHDVWGHDATYFGKTWTAGDAEDVINEAERGDGRLPVPLSLDEDTRERAGAEQRF